jgi:hypothetical protein
LISRLCCEVLTVVALIQDYKRPGDLTARTDRSTRKLLKNLERPGTVKASLLLCDIVCLEKVGSCAVRGV